MTGNCMRRMEPIRAWGFFALNSYTQSRHYLPTAAAAYSLVDKLKTGE